MKTQKDIWEAFSEGIPEAYKSLREHLAEETEETLFFVFMVFCEREVIKKLDLTAEETEKIISAKADRIYEAQSRNRDITLEECRKYPMNAGSLYNLLVEQLLGKQADFKEIKTLTDYQSELYGDLMSELYSIKNGLHYTDEE